MAKKKASVKKSLVQAKEAASSAILSHPVFRDMAGRLETMQKMLQSLPQAIGQAVAEATRQAPAGASGPAIPVVDIKEVEILPRKLTVDGRQFDVKLQPPRQIILEGPSGPSLGGREDMVQIAGVVRLRKEGVTIKPLRKAPGLSEMECVWSLETGKRVNAGPDDPWKISKLDLEVLVRCAAEILE